MVLFLTKNRMSLKFVFLVEINPFKLQTMKEKLFLSIWMILFSSFPVFSETMKNSSLPVKSLTEFPVYDASVLPEKADPAWIISDNTGKAIIEDGCITISGNANQQQRYRQNLSIEGDYTLELRTRINSFSGGSRALDIEIATGNRSSLFYLTDKALLSADNASASDNINYPLDAKEFHTYRFSVCNSENQVSIFIDEEYIMTANLSKSSADKFIRFGKGNAASTMEAQIDYITYDLTGAYAPKAYDVLQPPVLESFVNKQGMKMVLIEPGSFDMGAEDLDWDEKPVHKVNITNKFHMGATEVTNKQYEMFDPSHRALRNKKGSTKLDDEPVVYVSWDDAIAYCEWLSAQEGENYRLPTEAEWEYACRAGTATRYSTGTVLPSQYLKNNGGAGTGMATNLDLTVGKTPANKFGLHDMHGNVEEWCMDWYDHYRNQEETNPVGPSSGLFKVSRGGSHSSEYERMVNDADPLKRISTAMLSSSNRSGNMKHGKNYLTGFRVVQARKTDEVHYYLPVKEIPLNRKDILQDKPDLTILPAEYIDGQPYFRGPVPFVKKPVPPADTDMPFYYHNHVPAITQMPNGDMLAIWYNTIEEPGRELKTLASRKRFGSDEWEPASLFFDAPDRNEHGAALFWDGNDTIFHFSGYSASNTWSNLQLIMRYSTDNGATWSSPQFLNEDFGLGNMPIASVIKDRNGRIIFTCDAVAGGDGGSVIWVSEDHGKSWYCPKKSEGMPLPDFSVGKKGDWIAGIHATIVENRKGELLAFGRGDQSKLEWSAAKSISTDVGESWIYSGSGLPYIGGAQRITVQRLPNGNLFLASFARRDDYYPIFVPVEDGTTRRVYGLFAAISEDDGMTWQYKRLVTDDRLPAEYEGWGWQHEFTLSQTEGEPKGYITSTITKDGLIHLISSGNEYIFNEEWIKTPAPKLKESIYESELMEKELDKNVIYDGLKNLPTQSVPVWKIGDFGGVARNTNEGLFINVPENARCRYYQSEAEGFSVDPEKGLTIEMKMKISQTKGIRGLDFEIQLEDRRYFLMVGDTYMCYDYKGIARFVEDIDNKDEMHTFRMAIRPDERIELFRDGKLIRMYSPQDGRDTFFPIEGDFFRWGKGAGAENVTAVIEYVTYDVSGAYKPETTLSSQTSVQKPSNWSVYPIPAKDELYINGELADVKISLINMQGNVIKQFDRSHLQENRISLAGIDSGIYCLNISDQKQSSFLRFIVE